MEPVNGVNGVWGCEWEGERDCHHGAEGVLCFFGSTIWFVDGGMWKGWHLSRVLRLFCE